MAASSLIRAGIEGELILMETASLLKAVTKEEGMLIDYAKIYYAVMFFLKQMSGDKGYQLPIDIHDIYKRLHIELKAENLNEALGGAGFRTINKVVGKISIRPDYVSGNSKKTVYTNINESPALVNYALAHELCHLILNQDRMRYTDDYSIMPMLPKNLDELVADAFAIFLLIPLDKFLQTFKSYIRMSIDMGRIPISTEEWISYLGSVAAVPYYYVACAYQQIRHVAYLMYHIHIADEMTKAKYWEVYGEEVMKLYELVKDDLDEETIRLLYQ